MNKNKHMLFERHCQGQRHREKRARFNARMGDKTAALELVRAEKAELEQRLADLDAEERRLKPANPETRLPPLTEEDDEKIAEEKEEARREKERREKA